VFNICAINALHVFPIVNFDLSVSPRILAKKSVSKVICVKSNGNPVTANVIVAATK